MSLSDLASLGSFVSGLAVLVSLVFLYFQLRQITEQVRQAERNQRATNAVSRASRAVDVMLHVCDASMATAFAKAMAGDTDLTATQLQQFTAYAHAMFTSAEDTFTQHRHGMLEDSAYHAWLTNFSLAIAQPGFRLAWRQFGRPNAAKEFAGFIDELIDRTPMRQPPRAADVLAAWKSEFAELCGGATPVLS